MLDLVLSAAKLQRGLDELGLPNCVIGGLALQAWGEIRMTRDVDFTVMTQFIDEEAKIKAILGLITPRLPDALAFSLRNRVILGFADGDVSVDLGMGGFEFEEQVVERAVLFELAPEVKIRICSAEDLVSMKTFAGRPQDWIDIEGVIARQPLNWSQIEDDLKGLLELIDQPERLERLRLMKAR